MSATMKFVDVPACGDAEVMQLSTGPIPRCGDTDVLVKIYAAGVNRPDILQRKGAYPPPEGASPILGLEAAGEIVAVGAAVTQWQIGDTVCGLCNGGAYAEYVCIPAAQCLPVPAGLSMPEAASLPETCFTVWTNLFQRAHLKNGEHLLVHGGSSGIGVTAIQMAKAMGATVTVTAGSEEKCGACLALGADHAINYRQQDFAEEMKTLTKGNGVDVILDMVGGDYIQKNIRCAAIEGRIVNIAYQQGSVAEVNFMPVMLKRLTLTGSTLRPQSAAAKASIAKELREQVWPLIESGAIKPVLFKTFPLEQVIDAHRLMESNQHIGKIALEITQVYP